MYLNERLVAISEFVPRNSRVADIGTDHAYLPIYLVQNNRISEAIAGEVHRGPYEAARNSIAQLSLQQSISLRLGDGLSVLSPGEVDVAVIAGMGGTTIVGILSQQPPITESVRRLILQPMVGAVVVRQWLVHNGWRMIDEKLIQEDGKMYEIIVAEQGCSPDYEPILYDIGPILWEKRDVLLKRHLNNLLMQISRVVKEMRRSGQAVFSVKFFEYEEKMRRLEEKISCL